MKTPETLEKALTVLSNRIKSYKDGLISLEDVALHVCLAHVRIEQFCSERGKPAEEETKEEAPF